MARALNKPTKPQPGTKFWYITVITSSAQVVDSDEPEHEVTAQILRVATYYNRPMKDIGWDVINGLRNSVLESVEVAPKIGEWVVTAKIGDTLRLPCDKYDDNVTLVFAGGTEPNNQAIKVTTETVVKVTAVVE